MATSPRMETFKNVPDDDDAFTPYVNDKVLAGIMAQLPPLVLKGMETAAFRRMVNLVLRLFRTFAADEASKDMYIYGGYVRRTIVTKSDAGQAIADFERSHGPLQDNWDCDPDHNPGIWCADMFMDPAMDIDFHFQDMDQNNRFIEYLREFFDVQIQPTPDDGYPSRCKVRSFLVQSRLLDPMNIRLKIDVVSPTEDMPMLPDFTANQLRQTPCGTVYVATSEYFDFEAGFAPPAHRTVHVAVRANDAVLMRTIVEIENGITRLLLVPIEWFRTPAAATFMGSLVQETPGNEHKHTDDQVEKAYTIYLRRVFGRLPKIKGFEVVNFEASVCDPVDGAYVVRCCYEDNVVDANSVHPWHGTIAITCVYCAKKIVVFTDFMDMR